MPCQPADDPAELFLLALVLFLQHQRIAGNGEARGQFADPAKLDLDRVTWWVARSAAELMTSPDLPFVRECASYDCGWLFMDTTKNRSRRWCDMSTCGNRAKGRRHYERKRAASRGPQAKAPG